MDASGFVQNLGFLTVMRLNISNEFNNLICNVCVNCKLAHKYDYNAAANWSYELWWCDAINFGAVGCVG